MFTSQCDFIEWHMKDGPQQLNVTLEFESKYLKVLLIITSWRQRQTLVKSYKNLCERETALRNNLQQK